MPVRTSGGCLVLFEQCIHEQSVVTLSGRGPAALLVVHMLTGRCSPAHSRVGIGKCLIQCARKSCDIADLDHPAVFTMPDQPIDARQRRTHDRKSGSQCFDHHVGATLRPTGEYEDIGIGEELRYQFRSDFSHEIEAVGNTQGSCPLQQLGSLGTVASDPDSNCIAVLHARNSINQQIVALARNQTSNGCNPQAAR